jgi:alkylated DNA repair dioxygenase AlkB
MNPFDEIDEQSQTWTIQEDGIDIRYDAGFIGADDATRLFQALKNEIAWERHVINTPGGPKTVPRMISWHADDGLTYSYSGLLHQWKRWTPALAEIRDRLLKKVGIRFNGVLANFYENERDSVSPHADDETDMEEGAMIASVSLGETRDFVVKHMRTRQRHVMPLEHGSLLEMMGETQKVARHSIPKAKKPCGPRINLTFRQVVRTAP